MDGFSLGDDLNDLVFGMILTDEGLSVKLFSDFLNNLHGKNLIPEFVKTATSQ